MTGYQRFLKNNSALKSAVLGEYNNEDKYVISQDIAEELIKCNKILITYREEEAKCEAVINEQKYEFLIKFLNDKAENKRYASFYVLESFKHLGKPVDLTTFLISFVEENNAEYLDKLKSVFHLVTKDESEGKDIKNTSEVIGKLKQNKKYKAKQLNKELMMSNRKYIQDVLMVLKKSGPYGIKVQKMLKEKLANIPMDKNDPDYWAAVKEILDELLEETKDECSEEVKKWLELVNQNYIQFYLFKANQIKPFENRKTLVPSGVKHKSAAKKKKGPAMDAPKGKDKKKGKGSSKEKEEEKDNLSKAEVEKLEDDKENYQDEDSLFLSNSIKDKVKDNLDYNTIEQAINQAGYMLAFGQVLDAIKNGTVEVVPTNKIQSPPSKTANHGAPTNTYDPTMDMTF